MSMSLTGATGLRPTGSELRGNIIPKGYSQGQIQQYSPEQMDLFKSLFSHVGPESYLSKLAGGSEEAFSPMEERARRDFQSSLGQIGSRFSAMGLGAQKGLNCFV